MGNIEKGIFPCSLHCGDLALRKKAHTSGPLGHMGLLFGIRIGQPIPFQPFRLAPFQSGHLCLKSLLI